MIKIICRRCGAVMKEIECEMEGDMTGICRECVKKIQEGE